MKLHKVWALAAVSVLAFAACSTTGTASSAPSAAASGGGGGGDTSKGSVKIAVDLPLQGSELAASQPIINGIRLAVKDAGADVAIPTRHQDIPELAYLGGHRLGELLDIERRATAGALARRGRPNMTLLMESVDAFRVGELLMLLEMATAYAGELYGVNAFDQPGVELGKQFTYAMLGRADADAARQEWNLLPKPDPARVI